jgi:pyroglutamyl-peptidase
MPMSRVLITAFEPFDGWGTNSSWLTVVELTKDLPRQPEVTTRLYPVEFERLQGRLAEDLSRGFDVVLHLGQASGSSCIQLETVALNLLAQPAASPDRCTTLIPDGPLAYRSDLPAAQISEELRRAGIPTRVSYHAGTYLCNAALYLSHHYAAVKDLPTRAMLVHLPLDPSQVADATDDLASLPATTCAQGLRLILQHLAETM